MNAFAPVAGVTCRTADLSNQVDRDLIEAFVVTSAAAEPFHRPAWSVAVEQGSGQRSHYLLAQSSDGEILGLLPLTEVRSRLFGSALVSTGFGVGGGIIAPDPAVRNALAGVAWSLARELGCPSVELRGGDAPDRWERRAGTYAGFVRHLPVGDEAILKAIPRKQRAEVRRAQGFGLEVAIGSSEADRRAHYGVYAASVRNLGTPVFPRQLFDATLDHFGDDAEILTVRKEGEAIASVLSLYFRGTVYPYWGGGTHDARTWRANELMYYELMRRASQRGCTRFDFGRSKLGTGAYAYKKNWGFEPSPLTYWARGDNRETNPLSPKYRLQVALWKKLPLGIANLLGPPIARGLG